MENDPIEELFRRKIDETIPQEKPREAVWQKIEKELEPKTKKPLKAFIESVWFSAAVFALIAVPYFYFLIENINNNNSINSIVYKNVEVKDGQIKEIELESAPIDLDTALEFVQNSPIKAKEQIIEPKTQNTRLNDASATIPKDVVKISEQSTLQSDFDTIVLAKNYSRASDKTEQLNQLDSTLFAANKSKILPQKAESKITEPIAASAPTVAASSKMVEPIIFFRNRFTLQAQINRASFEFVKKQNNKLTFQNNDLKIFISRNKGVVSVTTSSDKIKTELLQLIVQNKESIFNYYINFPNPKNSK